MALRTKVPCSCTIEGYIDIIRPDLKEYPYLCAFCRGSKEVEYSVDFDHYEGQFEDVDWEKIDEYQDDLYAAFKCQCGDEMSLHEGGSTKACKCGRVYRMYVSIKVDKTHLGDPQSLIDLYQKKYRKENTV